MSLEQKVKSRESARSQSPELAISGDGDAARLALSGGWNSRHGGEAEESLNEVTGKLNSLKSLTLDLSGISAFDTAGAWLVKRLTRDLESQGASVKMAGVSPNHQILIDAVDALKAEPASRDPKNLEPLWVRMFAPMGQGLNDMRSDLGASMGLLGAAVSGGSMKAGPGRRANAAPLTHQIDHMGLRAVPIIALMSFLIGAIVAQQGAFQLRYFGAEIFVVDLVGILLLREIGVLLTAIMVAGRSGSAITAEIGSMKMREEIDALTVIGLNPVAVLVFPRLAALAIVMPLLTFVADISSLFGAACVTFVYSGISFEAFLSRLREAIDMTTLLAGFIKAPFMALIIGIVASVEGMKVKGSAESLGRRVTASVVKSIFLVIVIDGIFAVFYAAIDF